MAILKSRKCKNVGPERLLVNSRNRCTSVDGQEETRMEFENFVTAGGADGGIMGVNGDINAVSTKLVLDSLGVYGKVVCDMGTAAGKFMVCIQSCNVS